MKIWINASLLVCPHLWHLACLRPFIVLSADTLHLCHGVFATHKHIEHTCWLYCTVFTQHPVVKASPLVVLVLGLIGG